MSSAQSSGTAMSSDSSCRPTIRGRRSCRRAVTTITSASTSGRAVAARHPLEGQPGSITSRILYPSRTELARGVKRVLDHDWPIDGASDHGVSEAIYLHDPDHNGIELYRDR